MALNDETFEIGLSMSGAISAGSYSAGVLDFLFQALDEWHKAKRERPDEVPSHNVVIKVISGASAGSITGALAVASLRFEGSAYQPPNGNRAGYTLPVLYEAWVVNIDMLENPNNDGLLSTSDLASNEPVVSLLNANVIIKVGNAAFGYAPENPKLRLVPYLSDALHLYLTVSNLRGVPYDITFDGQPHDGCYGMLRHADRGHFIVKHLGASPIRSYWAADDYGLSLDALELPGAPGTTESSWMGTKWQICMDTARASSAFPIGLAAVQLNTPYYAYNAQCYPATLSIGKCLPTDFPGGYEGDIPNIPNYYFTCLDGGMINNDPFDFAHQALLAQGTASNPRDPTQADRAVIMIKPFPELPQFSQDGECQKTDMLSILPAMFSTLMEQSRFKVEELVAAVDENIRSRFLIGPSRIINEAPFPGKAQTPVPASNAIACGLLGGFGGFLSREFRDFDYQLGRCNCQQFLRKSFLLPEANQVFGTWPKEAATNPKFLWPNSVGAQERCIIPLLGACEDTLQPLDWPKMTQDNLDKVFDGFQGRADALIPAIKASLPGRILHLAISILWEAGVQKYALNKIQWYVKSELIRCNQYAPYEFGSKAERDFVAILANPGYDRYSSSYLAKRLGCDVPTIKTIGSIDTIKVLVTYDKDADTWAMIERQEPLLKGIVDSFALGPPSVAK
jgi:hypothetical protein